MLDLFGNSVEYQKEKTRQEDYQEYIASAKWKRIRDSKIDSVGGVCERCGVSKFSETLEVHHLHYRTFKHEKIIDLQVLCHKCHEFADIERQTVEDLEKKARHLSSSLYIGFIEWLKRGGEYIGEINSNKAWLAKEKFLTFLWRKQGRQYSLDLKVFGYYDENPNWKPGEK